LKKYISSGDLNSAKNKFAPFYIFLIFFKIVTDKKKGLVFQQSSSYKTTTRHYNKQKKKSQVSTKNDKAKDQNLLNPLK